VWVCESVCISMCVCTWLEFEHTLQRALSLADTQPPRLLQCTERLIDARDGLLVGTDIEVVDGMADELAFAVRLRKTAAGKRGNETRTD